MSDATAMGHATPSAIRLSTNPLRVLEIELAAPIPSIVPSETKDGDHYSRAMTLVRLHSMPIGWITIDLHDGALGPESYAAQIWNALSNEIIEHLIADGLDVPAKLPTSGFGPHDIVRCQAPRATLRRKAPFVSVIIPTHERADRLRLCLDSVLAMDYPAFDVIVVDSTPSSDTTKRLVASYGGAPVRYVREARSGSAAARNRGLAAATAEYVAFTDDDAIVDRYWLAELMCGFTRAPNVACVTGLVLPLELECPAQVWFEEYGGFSKGFRPLVFNLASNPSGNPMYPYNAGSLGHGNNMAVKRLAFRDIGNFDPTMGNGTPALGGVDSEALLRIIINGQSLVYQPSAFVYHQHRRTYEGLYKQVYAYGVGMTALLAKTLVSHPKLLRDFASKLPAALRYTLSPRSVYHAKKSPDYPRELDRAEIKGLLYGPLAYLRSVWWWHVSLGLRRRRQTPRG